MQPLSWTCEKTDGQARAGILELKQSNGTSIWLSTPVFMPVGTQGTVKGLLPEYIKKINYSLILANTYHLYLRLGIKRMEHFKGLHQFMAWDGALLTDSGGFQVFSLAKLNKITDAGVEFASHIDGKKHFFTPELSMQMQKAIGSNVVMAFDQCPVYPNTEKSIISAMDRTLSWAKRGLTIELQPHQARFGIIQGGLFEHLRLKAIEQITNLNFDGFSLGGLSIGEPPELMHEIVHRIASKMPINKPRYLMGVGRPEDLIQGVLAGIDMFDCVMPTRNARNGQLFTTYGKINIKNKTYQEDQEPLDLECLCIACTNFSKGYLRHLFVSKELLSAQLNTIHNLTFYHSLMKNLRKAICENKTEIFVKNFFIKYNLKKNNL